jgi:hypothetical protein
MLQERERGRMIQAICAKALLETRLKSIAELDLVVVLREVRMTTKYNSAGVPQLSTLSVLVKLASLAVHVEEYFSTGCHQFDKTAIDQLLADPEIRDWIAKMTEKGMLPVKRWTASRPRKLAWPTGLRFPTTMPRL